MGDSQLHRSAAALAGALSRLEASGFFGSWSTPVAVDGWGPPTDVLRAVLAECRTLLAEEVERSGGHLDGYGDAMLGYSLMVVTSATFSRCDTWGAEALHVREEFIELVLDYWDFICEHDTPGPMDLNKRTGGALDSIIGLDPVMLAVARERAVTRHPSIGSDIDALEDAMQRNAARAQTVVPHAVLLGWRSVVARWTASIATGAEVLPEVSDVVAAWADTLRAALEDDHHGHGSLDDDHGSAELLTDELASLELVAQHVIAHVGAVRIERLALALARLAGSLGIAAHGEQLLARPADQLTELTVELVGQNVHARRAIVRAPSVPGITIPEAVLRAVDGDADLPADSAEQAATLGLFDGIDAEALAVAELTRAEVRSALTRLLPHVNDRFILELNVGDDLVLSYVQGLVEDDGMLHVEVAHHSLVDVAPPTDGSAELLRLGWNPPTEELPNHWRIVDRRERSPEEIADLLVQAMDVAHAPFLDLPDDARLGISPAALGTIALAEGTPITEIDLVGDGVYTRVAVPDGAVSMHVPVELLTLWTETLDTYEGIDPELTVAEETRTARLALRATAHAARDLLAASGLAPSPGFVATVARIDALSEAHSDPGPAGPGDEVDRQLDQLLAATPDDAVLTAEDLGPVIAARLAAVGRRVDSAHRAVHGERAWSLEVLCDQDAETLEWHPIPGMTEQLRIAQLAEPELRIRAVELRALLDHYHGELQEELAGWPDIEHWYPGGTDDVAP